MAAAEADKPELVVQLGPTQNDFKMRYSKHHNKLVILSATLELRTLPGKLTKIFENAGVINDLQVLQDGRILTGGDELILWSPEGKRLKTINSGINSQVFELKVPVSGKFVVVRSNSNEIAVVSDDFQKNQLLSKSAANIHPSHFNISISPSGERIIFSDEKGIQYYDLNEKVVRFFGKRRYEKAYLLTERTIIVFEENRFQLKTFENKLICDSLAPNGFKPEKTAYIGRRIFSLNDWYHGGQLASYDVENCKLDGHSESKKLLSKLAFSPPVDRAPRGDLRHIIKTLEGDEIYLDKNFDKYKLSLPANQQVWGGVFATNSWILLNSGTGNGNSGILMVDVDNTKTWYMPTSWWNHSMDFSGQIQQIAIASAREVKLISSSGQVLHTINPFDIDANMLHSGENVYAVKFNRLGTKLFVGYWGEFLKVYDASGKIISTIGKLPDSIREIVVTKNDDFLAAKTTKEILFLKLDENKILKTYSDEITFSLGYDSTRNIIFSGHANCVLRLWTENGQNTKTHQLKNCPSQSAAITAITPLKDKIILGLSTGALVVFDYTFEAAKFVRFAHRDEITGIAFISNSKKIITGSTDNTIKIWDEGLSAVKGTLYPYSDPRHLGSALITTPDGRFDYTDKRALEYVSYRVGEKFVDLQEVHDYYYTPGLLKMVLDDTLPANETGGLDKKLKKLPDIQILSPGPEEAQDKVMQRKLKFSFLVKDKGGGVARAAVRVKGKLVWESPAGANLADMQEIDLTLDGGTNQVSVSAYNRAGGPHTETIDLKCADVDLKKQAKLFILSVGVNEYNQNPLTYSVADAKKVVENFANQSKPFFKEVIPIALYDKDATLGRIQKEIKAIKDNAGPDDVVMLYFSGHGLSVKEESGKKLFGFIPQDYPWRGDEATTLRRFGLTHDYLATQVKGMKPTKVVIIMDACHSGDAQLAFAKSAENNDREILEKLANGTGVFMLTSSAGKQLSREDPTIGHGIFTYVLLEGLADKAADVDGDGVVSIKELSGYMTARFESRAQKIMGKNFVQTPVINSMGRSEASAAALDFPLARVK